MLISLCNHDDAGGVVIQDAVYLSINVPIQPRHPLAVKEQMLDLLIGEGLKLCQHQIVQRLLRGFYFFAQ